MEALAEAQVLQVAASAEAALVVALVAGALAVEAQAEAGNPIRRIIFF